MPDRDVITAKISIIQRCLNRIEKVTNLDPESLDDIDKQDIFVLNLQRGIQAVIDLAAHVAASEGLGVPETIRENFEILKRANVISPELEKKMKAMTGFRNIAIHDYQEINREILKSILVSNLRDLEEFYTVVLRHFEFV